jgi:two-component system, NtrC family, C4-dicarboxylate transport sensor histidine kinase DctB
VPRFAAFRKVRAIGWVGGLFLIVLAVWLAHLWAERTVIEDLRHDGAQRLELYLTGLEAALARYDYLPTVLALNGDVIRLLQHPGDASSIPDANRYLAQVNGEVKTSAIYLLDLQGRVLASSNWNDAVSFIGVNLAYRPYFQDALNGRSGRFYGIGTTGGEPGYFFSHGIHDGGRMLGVAAVKVSLDQFERTWTDSSDIVIVADRHGVVLLSPEPSWKFKTLRPISPETMAIFQATRQYEGATLERIPLAEAAVLGAGVRIITLDRQRFLAHTRTMAETGWEATILSDLAPAAVLARNTGAAAAFALGFLLLLSVYLLERRHAVRASLAAKEALQRAHDELERKVAARTADLLAANERLQGEVAERLRADRVLREAQGELVQAGKMAIVGQLASGITHELNQPLAALRTLSDNAKVLLERNRLDDVQRNLALISELTDRMGKITGELKAFARKSAPQLAPVPVRRAIANAIFLVEHLLRKEDVELVQDSSMNEVYAVGESNRLEQVLINLASNAIDAMKGAPVRRLEIAVVEKEAKVAISVRDTGPGIAPDAMPRLFEPFFTTKALGAGLGLGLAISARIVREFGGTLVAANRPKGGAEFTLELAAATEPAHA